MGYRERFCTPDGMETRFGVDDGDDLIVVETVQDVEPILEHNKRLRNDGTQGYSKSRCWQRIAKIPNVLVHKWLREGINVFDENDWPKVERMLNSNEYAFLRTGGGRL